MKTFYLGSNPYPQARAGKTQYAGYEETLNDLSRPLVSPKFMVTARRHSVRKDTVISFR